MILLIKPPYNPAVFRSGESLGLNILGAVLKRQGYSVKLLDAALQNLSFLGLMQEIKRNSPRLLGLSITCSSFLPGALQLARAARKWDHRLHITVGGSYPSFADRKILEEVPEIDTVIRFEGEQALSSLCERVDQPELWHEIPNLTYRDGKEIRSNPAAPIATSLDDLPWPMRERHSFGPGIRDAGMLSSRGCPWDCTYCIQGAFYGGSGWRARSAADIFAEMQSLQEEWRAGAFLFHDDNFLGSCRAGRERALELAQLLDAAKVKLPWAISCLPVDVHPALLERLNKAGLTQVFLGVESGAQAALDRWNKKVSVAQNRKAVQILGEIGLGMEIGFVFFDPYTTMAELKENLEFLRATQAANTAPFMNRMEAHEGMAITERLRREGRLVEKDCAYHYRNEDERVDRVNALFHQILPTLAEAEHSYLSLRFQSQTDSGGAKMDKKRLKKLEKSLSDRVCRTAEEIIRFAQNGAKAALPDEEAFIAQSRNTLRQFNGEFR